MKKILTVLLISLAFQSYAQESTLKLSSKTEDVQQEPKKPFIQISYNHENVPLGKFANLDGIDPNWISSVTVLKDQSATALYGKDGEDGVIIIQLKSSPEIRAYFEKESAIYKKLTKVSIFQDASNRNVQEEKTTQSLKNQTISIRGEGIDLGIKPMILIEHEGEELKVDKIEDLNNEYVDLIESVQVLKDEKSLERYDATNKAGVVIVKFKSGKESDKAFKKLKKAARKDK